MSTNPRFSAIPLDVLALISSYLRTLSKLYPFQLISSSCHKCLISPSTAPHSALDLSEVFCDSRDFSPSVADKRLAYLVRDYSVQHVVITLGAGRDRLKTQLGLLLKHMKRRDAVTSLTFRFLKGHREVRNQFTDQLMHGEVARILWNSGKIASAKEDREIEESEGESSDALQSIKDQEPSTSTSPSQTQHHSPFLFPNITHLAFLGLGESFKLGCQVIVGHYAAQLRHLEFRRFDRRFRKDYNFGLDMELPVLERFIGDSGIVALLNAPRLSIYQGALSQAIVSRFLERSAKRRRTEEEEEDETLPTTPPLKIHLSVTTNSQLVRLPPSMIPSVEALHYEVKCSSMQELAHKLQLFPNVKYLSLSASSDIIDNTPFDAVFATAQFPAIKHVTFVDLDYGKVVGLKRNLIKLLHLFPNAGCTLSNVPNSEEHHISIAQLKLTLGHFLKVSQQCFESQYNDILIHQFNVLATILDRRQKLSKFKMEAKNGSVALPSASELYEHELAEERLVRSLRPSVKNYYQYCYSFPSPVRAEDKCEVWF